MRHGLALAVVLVVLAGERAAGAAEPEAPPDAQLLLDLDLLRDPELTQRRTLLERLRMIESLRLLERLNLFEAQTSTAPPPSREAR